MAECGSGGEWNGAKKRYFIKSNEMCCIRVFVECRKKKTISGINSKWAHSGKNISWHAQQSGVQGQTKKCRNNLESGKAMKEEICVRAKHGWQNIAVSPLIPFKVCNARIIVCGCICICVWDVLIIMNKTPFFHLASLSFLA